MLPHQMYGSSQGPSHSHGHKHRRRDLAKSHSNPALGSTMLFQSAPLPHVRGLPASSSVDGTGMGGLMYSSDAAMASVDPAMQNIRSGAFVPRGQDPAASVSKKPLRPLWRKDWRPSKVICAVPKLHQPSTVSKVKSVAETTTSESTVLDFPRDRHGSNLTLHCIDLHAHNRHVSSLLSAVHSRVLDDEPLPKPPDRFLSPASLAVKKRPVDLSSRSPLATVELDPSSIHKLLRKSTAAICAYTGYNDTSSQALDTLSTVLRDFLSNLTTLLHTNYDEALQNGGRVPFADCLDQSLQHCGIEGKAGLERYWKDSVKGFVSYLDEEIRDTTHEYIQLTNPSQLTPSKKENSNKSPELWPTNLDPEPTNSATDEEIPLDTVLEHTNISNVLPTKTPDLEGPVAFTQFSDPDNDPEEDTENLLSLGLDGPPPTKRLRTISFSD